MLRFGYGLCLYMTKKYVLAIEQFLMVKKDIEGLREADINIAKCYIAIDELGEAQRHIREALKSKEDINCIIFWRLCFEKQGDGGKYQLETIVENDPEFTEAWSLHGNFIVSGDWKNALVAYKSIQPLRRCVFIGWE